MDKYPYQNLTLSDMEGEIWKDIHGFEGYLMVSNKGRIKALARQINRIRNGSVYMEEKIVRQFIIKSPPTKLLKRINYSLNVSINIDNITYRIKPSRAVYATFIGQIEKNGIICHRDDDPLNNEPENLCQITPRELLIQNIESGRSVVPDVSKFSEELWDKIRKSRNVAISQYDREGNYISSFQSLIEAERCTGINKIYIGKVSAGKRKLAGGYIWKKGKSRKKLSPEDIAHHLSPTRYDFEKAINQYELNGNYITTFPSITLAAKSINFNRRNFSYRLSKAEGRFELNGYLWEYAQR